MKFVPAFVSEISAATALAPNDATPLADVEMAEFAAILPNPTLTAPLRALKLALAPIVATIVTKLPTIAASLSCSSNFSRFVIAVLPNVYLSKQLECLLNACFLNFSNFSHSSAFLFSALAFSFAIFLSSSVLLSFSLEKYRLSISATIPPGHTNVPLSITAASDLLA